MKTDPVAPKGSSPHPTTLRSAYQRGVSILEGGAVANANNEAFWLLEAGLGISRLTVYSDPEARVEPEDWARIESMFRRRASREPLQYIVGTQTFRGREFLVNPSVLIPRPETESIIEEVLASRFSTDCCHMVDMGTGSGCLAVSLALDCPGATILATDCSAPALRVARENARRHGVAGRIRFFRGECLDPLHAFTGTISVIVSNPPYVPEDQFDLLPRDVREFEPRVALHGGSNGLALYDRLLEESSSLLHQGGLLIMEMGINQSGAIRQKVRHGNAFIVRTIRCDQAGIERVICLERSS